MDIDQDEARAAALPPPELTAFLRGIKLQKLDTQLEQLGYDDVDDFENFDEGALKRLRAALEHEKIPAGHIDKLIRAITARRAAAVPQTPPPVATAGSAGSASRHRRPEGPSPPQGSVFRG